MVGEEKMFGGELSLLLNLLVNPIIGSGDSFFKPYRIIPPKLFADHVIIVIPDRSAVPIVNSLQSGIFNFSRPFRRSI